LTRHRHEFVKLPRRGSGRLESSKKQDKQDRQVLGVVRPRFVSLGRGSLAVYGDSNCHSPPACLFYPAYPAYPAFWKTPAAIARAGPWATRPIAPPSALPAPLARSPAAALPMPPPAIRIDVLGRAGVRPARPLRFTTRRSPRRGNRRRPPVSKTIVPLTTDERAIVADTLSSVSRALDGRAPGFVSSRCITVSRCCWSYTHRKGTNSPGHL
jgi:hypothetical protein